MAAPIVWRDDNGVLRLRGIVPGDGGDAIVSVWNFGDAALLRQHGDALHGFVVGKVLDGFQQLWVFLTHDPVKLRGLHSGLLHLLEGSPGVHPLMLPGVSDDENTVVWIKLAKE